MSENVGSIEVDMFVNTSGLAGSIRRGFADATPAMKKAAKDSGKTVSNTFFAGLARNRGAVKALERRVTQSMRTLEGTMSASGERAGMSFYKGLNKGLKQAGVSMDMFKAKSELWKKDIRQNIAWKAPARAIDISLAQANVKRQITDVANHAAKESARATGSMAAIGAGVSATGVKVGGSRGGGGGGSFAAGMASAGRTGTMMATLPALFVGKGMIDTMAEFEATMLRVQGTMGEFGDAGAMQMEKIEKKARELGATTEFTAAQVGEGFNFLAMTGLNAEQSLAVINPILDLATAETMEFGRAADMATNIMNQFGLQSENSAEMTENMLRVTNVLSATTSSANTNIRQLGEAMKYLGPNANALGIDIESTAAIVGVLGDAGIQGTLAGRALGSSFARLAKPTKKMETTMAMLGKEIGQTTLSIFDSKGETKDFAKFLGELEQALSGLSTKQRQGALVTMFGAEAFQEINVLLAKTSGEYAKYRDEITNTAKAEEKAENKRQGLEFGIRAMKSAWQELTLAIGDSGILESLTKLIQKITKSLRAMAETNPAVLKTVTTIAAMAALASPLMWLGGNLIKVAAGLKTLTTATIGAKVATEGMAAAKAAAILNFKQSIGLLPTLTTGFKALMASIAASPMLIAAMAAAAVYMGYKTYEAIEQGNSALREAKSLYVDITKVAKGAGNAIATSIGKIEGTDSRNILGDSKTMGMINRRTSRIDEVTNPQMAAYAGSKSIMRTLDEIKNKEDRISRIRSISSALTKEATFDYKILSDRAYKVASIEKEIAEIRSGKKDLGGSGRTYQSRKSTTLAQLEGQLKEIYAKYGEGDNGKAAFERMLGGSADSVKAHAAMLSKEVSGVLKDGMVSDLAGVADTLPAYLDKIAPALENAGAGQLLNELRNKLKEVNKEFVHSAEVVAPLYQNSIMRIVGADKEAIRTKVEAMSAVEAFDAVQKNTLGLGEEEIKQIREMVASRKDLIGVNLEHHSLTKTGNALIKAAGLENANLSTQILFLKAAADEGKISQDTFNSSLVNTEIVARNAADGVGDLAAMVETATKIASGKALYASLMNGTASAFENQKANLKEFIDANYEGEEATIKYTDALEKLKKKFEKTGGASRGAASEIERFAERVKDSLKTPQQELDEFILKLDEAVAKGKLSPELASQALANKQNSLNGRTTGGSDAFSYGQTDNFGTALSSVFTGGVSQVQTLNGELAQTSQAMLNMQALGTAAFVDIASAIGEVNWATGDWESNLAQVGGTILNSVVTAIAQATATWVAGKVTEMSIGKAQQAQNQAASATSAAQAATVSAAWLPAAWAMSVATGGTAAATGTAAFVGGLATATAASLVAGTVNAIGGAAIQGAAGAGGGFGGAFAKGGRPPVGRPSLVGEEGAELFIPDTAGRIIPNHDLQGMGGGSGGVSVTVQNNTGVQANAQVHETEDANGNRQLEIVMDRIASDITAGKGKIGKAIQNSYGVGRRGR